GIDADLQAHDVAALRRAYEARPNFARTLIECAHVARIVVVVYDLIAVCHLVRSPPAGKPRVLLFDSAGLPVDASQILNNLMADSSTRRQLAPPQVVSAPAIQSWSGRCLPSPSRTVAKAHVISSQCRSPSQRHSRLRPGC